MYYPIATILHFIQKWTWTCTYNWTTTQNPDECDSCLISKALPNATQRNEYQMSVIPVTDSLRLTPSFVIYAYLSYCSRELRLLMKIVDVDWEVDWRLLMLIEKWLEIELSKERKKKAEKERKKVVYLKILLNITRIRMYIVVGFKF